MREANEERVETIGREILAAMDRRAPGIFRKDFWNGKIMDWSMRDEAFKTEMFRFVDVFPVLETSEQLARHLQEYFCRPEQDFPAWIQLGLRSVKPNSLVARTAASQIERNIRSMASQFVAGENAEAALPRLVKLRREGMGFTVDLLGEATVSEVEAEAYAERYATLIRTLGEAARRWPEVPQVDRDERGPIPRANVSLKISALYSQIDAVDPEGSLRALKRRLIPLYELAAQEGVFLNIDMESHALKDLTIALFRSLLEEPALRDTEQAGIVLQAYLRSAVDDVDALIAWARRREKRVTVRLVKGAYWDYETIHAQQEGWPIPVFQNKWESDASFERCAQRLLAAHPHVSLAVASHNVRSVAAVLEAAERAGVPAGALEMQGLFGMADPLKQALVARGLRVREYVPVGELIPGMAYLVRRLLENTSNEGFLKQQVVDEAAAEVLLRRPGSGAQRVPDPEPDSPFRNAAHRDFADAAQRQAFADALARVRSAPAPHWPLRIAGESLERERRLVSTNPARPQEVVGSSACAGLEDVEPAVRSAWKAQVGWSARPVSERAAVLRALADRMEEERDELAGLMVLEVGKSWREADADVGEAIDFCRYYASQAEALMGEALRLGRYPGELNTLHVQPLGVGVVIAPWNFPLAILTGMTVGAIVTGNAVVLKPAEQSIVIAGRFQTLLEASGLPPGVVNFLPGVGEEVGAALAAHPWVRFVTFTGSREVGLELLRRAGETDPRQPGIRKVVAEMGGKNAIIVDDDADPDEAVAGVIHSAFGFSGQKCSACSRVIVLDTHYDRFVARLVEAARSLEVGPPEDPAFAWGPVIDAEARRRIEGYIRLGHQEATPLLVREFPELEGHFAPFAIFENVEPTHRIAQEEIFGPVLAVMRARNFDHAIELANGTAFALTGGVYSRSPANLAKARAAFRVGNLYINRGCTGALVFRQPFGGFKFSGTGAKAGGPNYLRQFVQERSISENTMRRGFAPDT